VSIRAGDLRERLVIQENAWPATAVALTRAGTTATGTTTQPHGYVTGDYLTVAGAVQGGYNGRVKVTVTGPATFTYPVDGSLATPATGTPTVVFTTDAQGGRRDNWVTRTTLRVQLVPIGAAERLQLKAMVSLVTLRFRARRRADITPAMRAQWPPTWPPGAPTQSLEIHGVTPEGDGTAAMVIECGVVA
jgi:head-tail adaptor